MIRHTIGSLGNCDQFIFIYIAHYLKKKGFLYLQEIACSSVHTVDVINRKHNALCAQIEHKISEVLLRRGDYSLVGELGSLKDKLIGIRKEAKQLARSLQ